MYGARIRFILRVGQKVTRCGSELTGIRLSQLVQGRSDGLDGLPLISGRKDRCKSPRASHAAGKLKFIVALRLTRLDPRLFEVLTVIIFVENILPGGKKLPSPVPTRR